MAGDNKTLGKFRLDGIPPAPRGVPQIEVTFDIDANGILNVNAQDKATGKEQQIQITASTNLSEDEVEQMVEQAREHEQEDKKRRELSEARNNADQLIYTVEKTMRELGDRLSDNDRQQVEELIQQLREAMETDDVTRIRNLSEQLQQATYAFSQQLYQAEQGGQPGAGPQPGGPQPGGPQASGNGEGDEDVVEGEFQEM
jgi:molecular chaperone DnaK